MAKSAEKKPVAKKPAAKKPAAKKAAKAADKASPTPSGMTDKEHLIAAIQEKTGASQAAAKQAMEAVLETVAVTLKKNQKLQLLGFGTFEVAKRKARTGRNPATGESIKIKASKTVRFKPGTKLKAAV